MSKVESQQMCHADLVAGVTEGRRGAMRVQRMLWGAVLCGCLALNLIPASAQSIPMASGAQPAPQQTIGGLASTAAQALQPSITNTDIVKMVKAGMSDNTVLLVIQKGPTKFDTSTNALIALKQAGVSETVITAMLTSPQSPAQPVATPSGMAGAASAFANAMQQPVPPAGTASMTPAPMPMPSTLPSMTASPPSSMNSMGGMPGASSMNQTPTAMGGMPGNTSMPSSGMPGQPTGGMPGATMPGTASMSANTMMQQPATGMSGMNTMPGAAPMPSNSMTQPAPATGAAGAANGLATQTLQNYGGNAMPAGTTALVAQGLQALTHSGSASVEASGIPAANLNPVQIESAVYTGTQRPGQTRGLMVWDSGGGSNPFLHSLENVAVQEAKLPANMTLPTVQRAPSGFGLRILTPTEWLVQQASDAAARGTPLQASAVTPDMIRPVLHVLGYYSVPGGVGGVTNVYVMDASNKNSLQPSATAPFFSQGVTGLLAEFPLDALAQLRRQDLEFDVVVTAANGKSKSFKIKKQAFAGLP
jgi:hypothetical protein